jgi:hypothetical protein
MNLVKVKEVYIDADDTYQLPVFVLEDGQMLTPKLIPTGSCWVLAWEAADKPKEPQVARSSADVGTHE